MSDLGNNYDAIIIGGGPAGATAALQLARAGRKVVVLEKDRFPRFHVGESMLPIGLSMIKDLGLGDRLAALPQVEKLGAEFAFGHTADEDSLRFRFTQSLTPGPTVTFNIERKYHDTMLLDAAREAGAEVRQNARVQAITKLAHHDVAIRAGDQELRAKWLMDASGQSAVVGRHLGIKQVIPSLRNVAFFGHFTGVHRLPGDEAGFPTIVMCDEGWFWIIPINETVTSCGMVLNQDAVRQAGVPKDQMLRWGIERCPMMARRLGNAQFPPTNNSISDFSYRCDPYAGPGYFLIGDAATFVDPIFSTGVGLGMYGGIEVARLVNEIDAGQTAPGDAAEQYIQLIKGSTKLLFELVHNYYDHSFRELMMNGTGPVQMHRAVISLLAGHVFPKPPLSIAWRFRMMQLCSFAQRHLRMVPRHPGFSLLNANPVEVPGRSSQSQTELAASA